MPTARKNASQYRITHAGKGRPAFPIRNSSGVIVRRLKFGSSLDAALPEDVRHVPATRVVSAADFKQLEGNPGFIRRAKDGPERVFTVVPL